MLSVIIWFIPQRFTEHPLCTDTLLEAIISEQGTVHSSLSEKKTTCEHSHSGQAPRTTERTGSLFKNKVSQDGDTGH